MNIEEFAAMVRRWTPSLPPRTHFEDTLDEVAEQAVADRLAGLVADGLSPLEAARLLFTNGGTGS